MTEGHAATTVTALVVVRDGGAALRATLASLAWAGRRCVLDPAAALPATSLPAGVEPWDHAAAGWVLLVAEGEIVTEALAMAVGDAVRGAVSAYRVAVECRSAVGVLRLRGRPVRLARGGAPAVRVSLGGEIGLVPATAARVLAGAVIARLEPALPLDGVDALDVEATVLAALAATTGVRPRFWRLVGGALVGGGRVLCGSAGGRLGWGRWIAAVLAAYRGLLVEAKLWERAQREVGWPPP